MRIQQTVVRELDVEAAAEDVRNMSLEDTDGNDFDLADLTLRQAEEFVEEFSEAFIRLFKAR